MQHTCADPRAEKIKVLPIAPMLAEAIRTVHNGESLGALFHHNDPSKMAGGIIWDDAAKADDFRRVREREQIRIRERERERAVK
jgi:hypothetical protein